jgi:ribosomal peptide maturation radical SAM protein 1
MTQGKSQFRVALVYPPFGPPNLPNLGLALLSAGVKARGFDCRTFYWNYRFMASLPEPTADQKHKTYYMMTQRPFSPWNEWAFARHVFPEGLAPKDAVVLRRLAELDVGMTGFTSALPPSQLILYVCQNAGALLSGMGDELAPFDLVGISSTFFQNGPALALAKHVKLRFPSKRVVLGGANCDGEMGRAILEQCDFLDCVFSGEVDYAFPDYVQRVAEGADIAGVPGAIYRAGRGRVVEGPPAQPLVEMNGLPVPDFDDYVAERKRFGLYREGELCLPLESSRGCWWGAKSHCTFCGLNANGMVYRQKTLERFREEVRAIVDRYRPRFLFMADNILSAKYYHEFIDWARAQDIGVDFFYEIKANMNRKQVANLIEAGISQVQPGIESFSTKTLTLMRKGIRGIHNIAFLKYAREYGLRTAYNILAGFPGEDPLEYERVAREVPKLMHLEPPNGVGEIEFHRFSPYHNAPDEFGIRLRPHEKYFYIYPFEESVVARLAYRFEMEGRSPQDLTYLRKIAAVVMDWRKRYRADECTLTWRRESDDVVIADRRPDFPAADYRLEDYAVWAFAALDQPTRLQFAVEEAARLKAQSLTDSPPPEPRGRRRQRSVAEPLAAGGGAATALAEPARSRRRPTSAGIPEHVVSFTSEEFADLTLGCLKPLLKAGLVYEEDGWFLALPVHEDMGSVQNGWARLGI